MLEKIKNLLITYLLFLPFALFAQMNDSIDFSQQITRFDDSVSSMTAKINEKTIKVEELLKRAPVDTESFEEKTSQISSPLFDKEYALLQAQNFSERLQISTKEISEQLAAFLALKNTMEQLSNEAQMLKQRLNNPISKAGLPATEQARLSQLITQAEQLQQTYTRKQAKLSADNVKLIQADDVVSHWINTLTGKLSETKAEIAKSETQKIKLEQQKLVFEKEADSLQMQLDRNIMLLSNEQVVALQEQIYHARTRAWLVGTDITLANIIAHRVTPNTINKSLSAKELSKQLQISKDHIADLENLQNHVTANLEKLKKHDALMGENKSLSDAFASTQKIIAYQLIKQESVPKTISDLLLIKNQSMLLQRQSWLTNEKMAYATSKVGESLLQIGYQLNISVKTLWQKIVANPINALMAAGVSMLLLVIGLKLATTLTHMKLQATAYERWIVTTLQKILATMGVLRYWIVSTVFVMLLVRALDVPSPSDKLIRLIAWNVIIALVGYTLLFRETKSKTLPKYLLIQGYVWFTTLIGTTLFYGSSVLSSVNTAVTALCEKSLMLALIGFSITLYRITRHHTRHESIEDNEKLYSSYRKIIMGLPLIGAIIGAVGIIGYQTLAWLSLKYLGIFTLIWVVVIVGLVVINHLRKSTKLFCAKKFDRGAFIAQDIVSPLSTISKLALLYFAGHWLFYLSGWDKNSYVVTQALVIADYQLITFGETAISLKMVFVTILSIYLIFHVARWLKRFAYHWLFGHVKDLGLRSSLAIFGQYLFTLFGLLITMKALGIDLTSLAVFAGALGVGIGLGLQDIAKSFISGIILLIERPLRTGDWVILDDSEGVVRSIGLRSITLETFDKQEVIIPNGNAINNSFTNYTHSNDINRTVLYVGASYSAPPKEVLTLLNKILNGVDGIMENPQPKVVLWEYADSSINYRIQYFININKNSIFDVKTEILSAIWYEFEENGIEIPFPQRDIHFKNAIITNDTEDTSSKNNNCENNE